MSYSIDLDGRVAFITGASSGLGAQFAKTLARAGAAVVLTARRMDKLKELRAQIEGEGGDAHAIELDVTDIDSIKAAVAHAETEVGSIDILVNNSGVSTTQRLQDVGEDDYDFIFDTNVKGAFFTAQEVAKRMLARSVGAAAASAARLALLGWPGSSPSGRLLMMLAKPACRNMAKSALVICPCTAKSGVIKRGFIGAMIITPR